MKSLEIPSWHNLWAEYYCHAGGKGFITFDSLTEEDKQIITDETGNKYSQLNYENKVYFRSVDPSIEYHYTYETTDFGYIPNSVTVDLESPVLDIQKNKHVYTLTQTGTQEGHRADWNAGPGAAVAIMGYKEGYRPFIISYSGNP